MGEEELSAYASMWTTERDRASINDPVFWLHHAFLDLQWQRWQRSHRQHRYLPAEPPDDADDQHGRVVARHEKLPPWDETPDQLKDLSRIYRYA